MPAADSSGNLSELLVLVGDLPRATEAAHLSLTIAKKTRDKKAIVYNGATLADAMHQQGQWRASEQYFRAAEDLYKTIPPHVPYLHRLRGHHFCDLLLDLRRYEEVEARSRAALEIDKDLPFAVALALLMTARVGFIRACAEKTGDTKMRQLAAAEACMDQALQALRQANHEELIVRGLLASADLRLVLRKLDAAEADLKKAVALAQRSQMGLSLADAQLHFARLYLARGQTGLARKCLAEGQQMVQRMCYHRRNGAVKQLETRLSSAKG